LTHILGKKDHPVKEYVSSVITENIKNKNIVIEPDGTLSGQLIYEEDE